MAFFGGFPSDEVNISGFNRDASPVYTDDYTPYFDSLSFLLTAIPSDAWVREFRNRAPDYIDREISQTCYFQSGVMTISTTKTYANSLQEFIDSLKKAIESVNEHFKQERDKEAEQEKEVNDILDNLKF